MNKNELIAKVAEDANLSKSNAGDAVDATLNNILKALKSGDDVRIVGFGTFTVTHRAAGEARDPRTGAKIHRPASRPVQGRQGAQGSRQHLNCRFPRTQSKVPPDRNTTVASPQRRLGSTRRFRFVTAPAHWMPPLLA